MHRLINWLMPVVLLLSSCDRRPNSLDNEPSNVPTTQPNSGPSSEPNNQPDKKALVSYLATPSFNSEVEKLAKIGVARYQDPSTNLMAMRDGKTGGGRTATWIKDTFNKDELEIIKLLENEDAPKTWTTEQIDAAYNDMIKLHPADASLTKANFVLVKGVGVNYLHEAPLGKDSILQLASQFNYLESPGTHKVPVSDYLGDHTQGPQGSIEAAAAALHRTAAEKAGKLSNALTHVLPNDHGKYYQNGYLELYRLGNKELKDVSDHIEANLKKMAILLQWVISEASGNRQLQVFSAAPSYQGSITPAPGSIGAKLSSLLVANQYRAIAELAVIRSLETKKPVAVHLTLVGQGAFSNPPEVMADALKSVAEAVKGYSNVHVYVHGYGDKDQALIRKQSDKSLINLTEMDKDTFMRASL